MATSNIIIFIFRQIRLEFKALKRDRARKKSMKEIDKLISKLKLLKPC